MVGAKAARVLKQNMRDVGEQHHVSASRIAYASVVLDHQPDLADDVIESSCGEVPLPEGGRYPVEQLPVVTGSLERVGSESAGVARCC